MATKKKLLQAAAGSAGGAGLNVEEVFSTYLYEGNSSTNTITNNIDLSGEGGMVWLHGRSNATGGIIYDTERGVSKALTPHTTSNPSSTTNGLTAFNSDGFTLTNTPNTENFNGYTYASWTFRKAPKFFDCVTWTGDGVQGRSISHNLGSVPAVIITKKLNATDNWVVYHRSNGAGKMLYLNGTNSTLNSTAVYPTTPTDSVFYVGNDSAVNGTSSDTYVAYLFAHNDGDGEFGPDADQDIIKCGVASYPSSGDVEVDLGFEPQWVLLKDANHSGNSWWIIDTMRGWDAQKSGGTLSSTTGGKWQALFANLSNAETSYDYGGLTPTGFKLPSNNNYGDGNTDYIYIAIRRGPMAVPTSATDVFHVRQGSATADQFFSTGFDPDLLYSRDATNAAANNFLGARLTGQRDGAQNLMWTNATTAETATSGRGYFGAKSKGYYFDDTRSESMNMAWGRAPNFFDVVAYTGDGTSNRAIEHNLGVAPEMIWVKARNISYDWVVKHKDLGRDELTLNATTAAGGNLGADFWGAGTDTSTVFHTANSGTNRNTNGNNDTYIAYLFASLDGISKVGSYTGNGTNQTINCGFSAGARFILIKRTDSTGPWYIWDTERGIISGNDPYLRLNLSSAEVTTNDSIDPDNSGFIVNQVTATNINVSSATYIFYAIA